VGLSVLTKGAWPAELHYIRCVTVFLFLGVIYALYGNHVLPSVCGLVSVTEPLVGFS
jgi:hypothetical protein